MTASPKANRTTELTRGDCACPLILPGAQTVDHDCLHPAVEQTGNKNSSGTDYDAVSFSPSENAAKAGL